MSDNMDKPYYQITYCGKRNVLYEVEDGIDKHKCKPTLVEFERCEVCTTCGCVVADITTHKQYHSSTFSDGIPVADYEGYQPEGNEYDS